MGSASLREKSGHYERCRVPAFRSPRARPSATLTQWFHGGYDSQSHCRAPAVSARSKYLVVAFVNGLKNASMPCCHFSSPTIASRSMSPKCFLSNLRSSHAAPASHPWRPVMSNSMRGFPCSRSSRSNSDTKGGLIRSYQRPVDMNYENLSIVFFIELNGHLGSLIGLRAHFLRIGSPKDAGPMHLQRTEKNIKFMSNTDDGRSARITRHARAMCAGRRRLLAEDCGTRRFRPYLVVQRPRVVRRRMRHLQVTKRFMLLET